MESTSLFEPDTAGRRGEEVLVQAWQTEQLRRLGLSRVLAQAFAGRIDWHELAALVEQGCPADLALEIVR
jgi:hypothetical protein